MPRRAPAGRCFCAAPGPSKRPAIPRIDVDGSGRVASRVRQRRPRRPGRHRPGHLDYPHRQAGPRCCLAFCIGATTAVIGAPDASPTPPMLVCLHRQRVAATGTLSILRHAPILIPSNGNTPLCDLSARDVWCEGRAGRGGAGEGHVGGNGRRNVMVSGDDRTAGKVRKLGDS
jgi:hypothetical protein